MCGTWEPVALMLREKYKRRTRKYESTDAGHRRGATRSSDEDSVNDSVLDLVHRADQALYKTKENGRSQVQTAPEK
ncbi:hypothetical protein [uncultured Desulfobacter sp.]|uniref:hypothetical protein n=1 Tax=uncultured Desulfobacter sp. TaxID=240139 RepID=UPI0029F4C9B3|nr:hypothetical protein [uncultured Desulfobacter sp.]